MSFRRSAAVALAAVALVSGCTTTEQEAPLPELVIAAFNSAQYQGGSAAIPTPNDLALQAAPTLPAQLAAQKALLQAFVVAGGFPSDQAVGITIPLKKLTFDSATKGYLPPANAAAALATGPVVDPASLTTTGASPSVVVLRIDVTPPVVQVVEVDAENCITGQIALKRAKSGPSGSRAWAPGRYAFALRGGASGVRTKSGLAVEADTAIALVWRNQSLANKEQQPPGGLPADVVARLESVRGALWNPVDWGNPGNGTWTVTDLMASGAGAFPAISAYIPPEQVAVIGTFEVAPAIPTAPVDSGSGIAPLPLDLLRTGSSGTTIAFNTAFGPAAQGLTTLDGFSTTAMIFAPVTVPVDASTVHGGSVRLYKVSGSTVTMLPEFKASFQAGGAAAAAVSSYVAQPPPIVTAQGNAVAPGVTCAAAGGCSLVIGLQPAAVANGVALPPLDEATDYAVVITTAVKDMLGRPLQKATVAKILVDPGFDPVATASVNGTSLLSGISNETASALMRMRAQLAPVLAASGLGANDVALAYTFRTQGGIAKTGPLNALTLAGVPYAKGADVAPDADAITTFTPAAMAATYGIDPALVTTYANAIAQFAEVKFHTSNWLLGAQGTGAFDPFNPTTETVTAVVALPDPALVTGVCAGPTPCAPLVVFEHGLGSSKANVLPIAAALAARGFVVAAMDMPLHGERSYCTADNQCCPAAICGTQHLCAFKANLRTPVDPAPIGVCESAPGVRGRMLDYKVSCASNPFLGDGVTPNPACLSPKGFAYASANRLISLNFFRVRDTLRQDVIDVSALVKSLAPLGANAFTAFTLASHGYMVDATKVYWIGHSGGTFAASGTLAANPRITRGVGYAGGATAIDVFANPESGYNASLLALLGAAGIAPGTPDYLKFLQIGKWILDPADPANFARYYVPATSTPLPNQLLGGTQPAREILSQFSLCDGTVPNTQNILLAGLVARQDSGVPLASYAVPLATASTTGRVQWFTRTGAATCPGDAVGHSNPFNFANPSLAWKAQDQLADFLLNGLDVVTPVTE